MTTKVKPAIFFHGAATIAAFLCVVGNVEGVLFSSLPKTFVVKAGINGQYSPFQVAKAGIDQLHVQWVLNGTGVDSGYKKVKSKLCFAPLSQIDRKWRKANDDLTMDKTCPQDIAIQAYTPAGNSSILTIPKSTPGASYFVRVYALDASGNQVAVGQTTNSNKTTNIFVVEPITGRHASIDIAVAVFSCFSVLSLLSFFVVERMLMKGKKQQ